MAPMICRCIVFLGAALTLANCCALGNGCGPTAGAPVAWDGLATAADEDTQPLEPQPRQHARKKREKTVGYSGRPPIRSRRRGSSVNL